MKREITHTGDGQAIHAGDVVLINGKPARVLSSGRGAFRFEYLSWRERLAAALRGKLRLRGFWARVWNR